MGSFQFSGSFSTCNDPNYQSYGLPERGAFIGGKPIRQGHESGLLKFPPLVSGGFHELRVRWEEQKDSYTQGTIPKFSGYGWRSVSAWWHEPVPTGWDGGFAHGVTMKVTRVANN